MMRPTGLRRIAPQAPISPFSTLADEPPAQGLHTLDDLLGRGLGHLRTTAHTAKVGVHNAMGLTGTAGPGSDELAQLFTGGGPSSGIIDAGVDPALRRRSRLLLLGLDLLVLTLTQQGRHLLRLKQTGQTEVLLLFDTADHGAGAELTAVEQDPVELSGGVHGLESAQQVIRGLLLLVGIGYEPGLGGVGLAPPKT